MMGIVASRMPTSVTARSGGRKISPCDTGASCPTDWRRLAASQRGDSGTAISENTPSTTGPAPASITHRHESGVIFTCVATVENRKIPMFADVPITPATIGRDIPDHASETSATPFGHIPPTPVQARNQQTSRCSGDVEKYAAPAIVE